MLDVDSGYVPTGNSRESVERDTLTAHVVAVEEQIPTLDRANGAITLKWIGEQVGDETLGKFDLTEDVSKTALTNARQNARNWTDAAVKARYPGFGSKFEFYAIPEKVAGQTVAIRFALRGVKAKASDEV